jgi:hypothetical protein
VIDYCILAISVLAKLTYSDAVQVLDWKWDEFEDANTLSVAYLADCKDFFSTTHVQHMLDAVSYPQNHLSALFLHAVC